MINHRRCTDRALIALIATLRLREAVLLARYLAEVRRRRGRARRQG